MDNIDYFYFIVDSSGSMTGRKLGAVNDAINNIIHRLKRFSASRGVNAKITLLSYADVPSWSNFVPVDVNSFTFTDIMVEGEKSNIGTALIELNEKLKRQGESDIQSGKLTTVIFFTDGLFTEDLSESVKVLNNNRIYVQSTRIGLTFSDELSQDIAEENLIQLVDRKENIIIDDFVELNKRLFEKYR